MMSACRVVLLLSLVSLLLPALLAKSQQARRRRGVADECDPAKEDCTSDRKRRASCDPAKEDCTSDRKRRASGNSECDPAKEDCTSDRKRRASCDPAKEDCTSD